MISVTSKGQTGLKWVKRNGSNEAAKRAAHAPVTASPYIMYLDSNRNSVASNTAFGGSAIRSRYVAVPWTSAFPFVPATDCADAVVPAAVTRQTAASRQEMTCPGR